MTHGKNFKIDIFIMNDICIADGLSKCLFCHTLLKPVDISDIRIVLRVIIIVIILIELLAIILIIQTIVKVLNVSQILFVLLGTFIGCTDPLATSTDAAKIILQKALFFQLTIRCTPQLSRLHLRIFVCSEHTLSKK